ncbi:hypothetical protein EVAR_34531_1 [Eumeta japonica]|uniref:Uncharacterized protein n=1 Tax=Eumeta variegata TaxID=151549 RepID=A0A4C1X848_EUMVA|nr:hypothetical protein EVAR_34531_1 [Eumeta japonica]
MLPGPMVVTANLSCQSSEDIPTAIGLMPTSFLYNADNEAPYIKEHTTEFSWLLSQILISLLTPLSLDILFRQRTGDSTGVASAYGQQCLPAFGGSHALNSGNLRLWRLLRLHLPVPVRPSLQTTTAEPEALSASPGRTACLRRARLPPPAADDSEADGDHPDMQPTLGAPVAIVPSFHSRSFPLHPR